uniref:PDZ domain-containing protein n=1 Tax=Trichobilharzia regenti TaxID=157069 RepID=A0AA85IYS4_TRIRE|nr:unnamed protein product [Trichobilharzia regenti]
MSEESEKPREIVSSYDEILEITGLLPICDNRRSYVGDDKEDKENSSPQNEGGNGDNILRLGGGVSGENDGDDDDEGIVPVLSTIQLQHGSSLMSITADENNTTNVRTISIAKTKNNDVGFMFTEIKQGLFVSHVDERSSASLNRVRFGDKIQCINGIEVTSYSQAKQLIEKTHPTVEFSIIDCPYRESKTLYKIRGRCGLFINDGMILDRTRYFSPKSDKCPLNYYITEINNISSVRLLDEEIVKLIEHVNSPFTLHIVPQWFYEYLVYGLDPSCSSDVRKKTKKQLVSFNCFRQSNRCDDRS